MPTIPRRPTLALLGGFGLLTACPSVEPPAAETDSAAATSTTTGDEPPATSDVTTDDSQTSTTTTTTTTTTTDPIPTTTAPVEPTTTLTGNLDGPLCVALGGRTGVAELVGAAFHRLLVDDQINAYFLNSDVDGDNFSTCLNKQIGALAGCDGIVYDCQDMAAAHQDLGISSHDFADFVADFALALDDHQTIHPELGDADKDAILSQLGGLEADIVGDIDNNQTVYQRIGRKPALRAIVGFSGQADSFLDNVALDPAINVFFGLVDYNRLNTCLTRQLAAIDGPSKYGFEVSAPPPADPGVGLGDPCKPMAEAHADMLDANNAGIDFMDFSALLGALVDALAAHDVAQADQDAIVAVLADMCEDIVALEWKNHCPGARKLDVVELVGLAAGIPDKIYDGTTATMICYDLVFPYDALTFVDDVEVTVAIQHGWVGDLTIKLVSPDDKILTLLSRPGLAEQLDDGSECCGDSSNLSAAFPLTFRDAADVDAEQIGAALPGTDHVVCKDDLLAPCEWAPSPGSGPGVDFSDFRGDTAVGAWKLCVGDANVPDAGMLDAIELAITRVKYDPTP